METITRLEDLAGRFNHTAVALGTFDGVHIGHQRIIAQAVELAAKNNSASVVFTFANHPLEVISPGQSPPLIVTPEYKAELIAALGVDLLVTVPFTETLLRLAPEEFIRDLAEKLRPDYIVVGPNYTFGRGGAGTPETLKAAASRHGFEVVVPSARYAGGRLVSSTAVRRLVLAGKVDEAALLLGRPLRFGGLVETGDGRGSRVVGFPTANLAAPPGRLIPGDGVYAARILLDSGCYQGLVNIGDNPTFKVGSRRIEAFILDFTGNLYGKFVTMEFLAKLRDEITFSGAEELKRQIAADIAAARSHFG